MELNKCMGCMEDFGGYPCPRCGYDPAKALSSEYALQPQTILGGKYLVGRVLGQGGFGITYIGWDIALGRKVAIKEYFPSGQVSRTPGTRALTWYSTEAASQARQTGMEMFLKEARKMAKAEGIAHVVRVRDLFQENGTAYIVMDFVEGETLKARLKRNGPLSWDQAKAIFLPAIQAMDRVHQAGLIHRDLSPDNLMLTPDGQVMILDLGAAKDLNINTGNSSMQVAKSGFSPLEQYTQRGGSGPWTDVYAMAATVYYSLTGHLPPNAVDRVEEDTISWTLPGLERIPKSALAALQGALAVYAKKRTQSMQALEDGLFREAAPAARQAAPEHAPGSTQSTKGTLRRTPPLWVQGVAAVAAVLVVAGGIFGLVKSKKSGPTASGTPAQTAKAKTSAFDKEYAAQMAASRHQSFTLPGNETMEIYWDGEDRQWCRIYTNAQGARDYSFTAEYDGDGNLILEKFYDGDGTLQRRTVNTWTEDGQPLKQENLDGGDSCWAVQDYSFDSQGRCTGWVRKDGKGKTLSSSAWTYDTQGGYTVRFTDADGLLGYVSQYDSDGKESAYISYNSDGTPDFRQDYEYDSNGQLLRTLEYSGSGALNAETRYLYEGDLVQQRSRYVREALDTTTTYSYGAGNILLSQHSESWYSVYDQVDIESIGRVTVRMYNVTYANSKQWRSWESLYDWTGKQVSSNSYREDGSLSYTTEFRYDASGKRQGSTSTNYGTDSYTVTEYDTDYNPVASAEYDLNQNKIGWTEYIYSESTMVEKAYDKTGLVKTVTHSYDTMGNEIQTDSSDADGKLTSHQTYSYDSMGQKTGQSSTYYYDDFYSVSEYDGDYNILSYTSFNLDGSRERWSVYTYSENFRTETSYDTTGLTGRTDTQYNEQGKTLWEKSYDGTGKLTDETVYTYDEQGERIGQVYTRYSEDEYTVTEYNGDGDPVSRNTYSTDGTKTEWSVYTYSENFCSRKNYDTTGLTWQTDTQYNDQGNTLWEKSYDGTGKLTDETDYTYDEQGNSTGYTYTYYNSDGSKTVTAYDGDYNRLSRKKYDSTGKLVSSE